MPVCNWAKRTFQHISSAYLKTVPNFQLAFVQSHFENDIILAVPRPFAITVLGGKFSRIKKNALVPKESISLFLRESMKFGFFNFSVFTRHRFQVAQFSKIAAIWQENVVFM